MHTSIECLNIEFKSSSYLFTYYLLSIEYYNAKNKQNIC